MPTWFCWYIRSPSTGERTSLWTQKPTSSCSARPVRAQALVPRRPGLRVVGRLEQAHALDDRPEARRRPPVSNISAETPRWPGGWFAGSSQASLPGWPASVEQLRPGHAAVRALEDPRHLDADEQPPVPAPPGSRPSTSSSRRRPRRPGPRSSAPRSRRDRRCARPPSRATRSPPPRRSSRSSRRRSRGTPATPRSTGRAASSRCRASSLSSRKHPLRVPTSSTVRDMPSPPRREISRQLIRLAAVAKTHRSSTIVTGPSLTSSTAIRAPNTPVATSTPSVAERRAERLVDRLGLLRRRRVREARAVALRRVGDQRELRDDERGAAGVEERAVELAVVVLEDPQPRDLAGEPLRVGSGVAARDAEQDAQPGADLAAGRDRAA